MLVVPFEPRHLADLQAQPAQTYIGMPIMGKTDAEELAAAGPAFSAIEDGKVVGCSGLVTQWPGRAIAWMLLSDCGPTTFLKIHRAVMRALSEHDFARIETAVDHDFENGHRWMRFLGFELETPDGMRCWSPDGRTFDLYARVKWQDRHS